jgi:hypothetical protein
MVGNHPLFVFILTGRGASAANLAIHARLRTTVAGKPAGSVGPSGVLRKDRPERG